jgi:hypothetical protein
MTYGEIIARILPDDRRQRWTRRQVVAGEKEFRTTGGANSLVTAAAQRSGSFQIPPEQLRMNAKHRMAPSSDAKRGGCHPGIDIVVPGTLRMRATRIEGGGR